MLLSVKTKLPAPLLVKPKPSPEITPDAVNAAPVATSTVLLAPKITLPAKELAPVLVLRLPPLRVTASLPTATA